MKTLMQHWEMELKLLAAMILFGLMCWLCNLARAEELSLHPTFRAMVDAVNEERQARGHAPLIVDRQLQVMAETWGQRMANDRWMRHSGYSVGENVAMGQVSVAEVTTYWMSSSGHRANILGQYTKIGCAGYQGTDGRCYWVQCFR